MGHIKINVGRKGRIINMRLPLVDLQAVCMQVLSKAEKAFIGRLRVCRLATASADGQPHVVPVCHAFDGSSIYFATDLGTKKLRNIKENDKVAIIFDEYFEPWGRNRGVEVLGKASLLAGEEFRNAAKLITEKFPYYKRPPYGPLDESDTAIVKVEPLKALSWGLRGRRA